MLSFLFVPLAAADGLAVASLAVEHLIAPDGVDVTAPRFSWHLVPPAGARGVVPLASQLQVSTEPDFIASSLVMNATVHSADVSMRFVPIVPHLALRSSSPYFWRVRSWANVGSSAWSAPATFSTGVLSADEWRSAAFLGGSVLPSGYVYGSASLLRRAPPAGAPPSRGRCVRPVSCGST